LRVHLILIVIGLIGILVISVALPLMPLGNTHPPQVKIYREYGPDIMNSDNIKIFYEGGIDSGFVGNFMVVLTDSTGFEKTYYFDNPGEMMPVSSIPVNHIESYCVNVSAIDKATRVYRAIGSACL